MTDIPTLNKRVLALTIISAISFGSAIVLAILLISSNQAPNDDLDHICKAYQQKQAAEILGPVLRKYPEYLEYLKLKSN